MLSWSELINHIQIRIKALSLIISFKRASLSPFFGRRCRVSAKRFTSLKASMTLEASIVLPIFLFYMMTLLYTLEIVRFQSDVWEAMHRESTEICFQSYETVYGYGAGIGENSNQGVINYLREQFLPYLCVKNGEQGIRVQKERDFLGKGNVKISVTYEIKPFIGWLPTGEIVIEDNCFVHGWVGYQEDALWGEVKETEEYVYITPSGNRYHISESCTYIKVQIQAADCKEI